MTGIIGHRNLGTDSSPFKSSVNSYLPPPPPISPHPDEVDNVDYRFEMARLQSFDNWPLRYMDPRELAKAGFYYMGEDDKVRCFECNVEICQWLEGDDPMVDHQRWSGRCRFIRKIPCGNVPLGVDPSTVPPPRPRSRDVCGPYGVEYRPMSAPDTHSFPTGDSQLPSATRLSCLGIGRQKGPKNPEYASYEARLRTFETWPKSMPQTKEQLADAGFYYTGKGDQTLCYHCGGGLKDWEPEDDPWEQHAKWFSTCHYLLLVKGQEYINKITGQTVIPPSKEETMQMNLPSFIKKVEQPVEEPAKEEGENNPGPSSERTASQHSGTESIGLTKGSTEDLSPKMKAQPGIVNSKSIDDARMCKICYNGELGVVFLPCGHIVACVKCAPGMTTCAVCREPVTMTVRAFFA